MVIRKKRIRNISRYISDLPRGGQIRPAVPIDPALAAKLPALGFEESPTHGDTVLPKAAGPVGRFNADGRWLVHRDRPKERRFVRAFTWRWTTWDGVQHDDTRDIYRDCWQRSRVPPPAIELTIVEQGGESFLVAPSYRNEPGQHGAIRHAVNLLLEIAGQCELLAADLGALARPPIKRVAWRMLPPGRHPFPRMLSHLEKVARRSNPSTRRIIWDRQEAIHDHHPSEIHIGQGGFENYIAYVFADRGLVVLECIRQGNATYVFGMNWKSLSSLSKAEIIDGRHHVARLIHSTAWRARISETFEQKMSA